MRTQANVRFCANVCACARVLVSPSPGEYASELLFACVCVCAKMCAYECVCAIVWVYASTDVNVFSAWMGVSLFYVPARAKV